MCTSLIEFSVLAQQICYNGRATIAVKHVNSTLKGVGKNEGLPGSQIALLK